MEIKQESDKASETRRPESSSSSSPPYSHPKIDDLDAFHAGTYIRTVFRAVVKNGGL